MAYVHAASTVRSDRRPGCISSGSGVSNPRNSGPLAVAQRPACGRGADVGARARTGTPTMTPANPTAAVSALAPSSPLGALRLGRSLESEVRSRVRTQCAALQAQVPEPVTAWPSPKHGRGGQWPGGPLAEGAELGAGRRWPARGGRRSVRIMPLAGICRHRGALGSEGPVPAPAAAASTASAQNRERASDS